VDLAIGDYVKHSKLPDWGRGRVIGIEPTEKKVQLIFYKTGKETKFKISPNNDWRLEKVGPITPAELIKDYRITAFYHFTDKSNIASIRETGGLYSISELEANNISPPRPGGNEWSHRADKKKELHKYVHLSFMDWHPMASIAKEDGRIPHPITLHISPEVILFEGVLFSADVSNKSGVEVFDIEGCEKYIDFDTLYSEKDWRNEAGKEARVKASKAEVLIPNHVPIKYLLNI
jgi:hypothetical protein